MRVPRLLDHLADHLLLTLCELRRSVAVAHRSVELSVVRARENAVQIAVARHADDLVRSGRPRDEVAPLAVRALEAQVDLQVVVQRDRLVRRELMPGPIPRGSRPPTWMLLADITDKRENSLPPELWFDRVNRNLHKWATRIRMWIRRAVNRVTRRRSLNRR